VSEQNWIFLRKKKKKSRFYPRTYRKSEHSTSTMWQPYRAVPIEANVRFWVHGRRM